MIVTMMIIYTTPPPPGKRHTAPSEPQNPQLLMAQQALRGNIQEGLAVAHETEGNLHSAASLPPLGSDSVSTNPVHVHVYTSCVSLL